MNRMYSIIEELCSKRGISVTKMCKEAGVSRAPLTELKKGRTQKLSVENSEKIASYFGVSVSYLLGTETKNQPADDGLVNDDPELTELLQMLQDRPEFKMLFHTFKSATKEQIEAIVTAWEARNNIKEE